MAPKNKKPSVVEQWRGYFGKGDLDDWQRLCGDLGLKDDLPSKKKCRVVGSFLSHWRRWYLRPRLLIQI